MSADVVSPSRDVTLLCPALAPPGLRMCHGAAASPGRARSRPGWRKNRLNAKADTSKENGQGTCPVADLTIPPGLSIIPKAVLSVEGRGCATVVNFCTPFPLVFLVAVLRLIDARTAIGFSFQEFTTCIMSNQGSLTIIKSPSSVLTSVLFQVRESNWRTSAVRPSFSLTIDPTR